MLVTARRFLAAAVLSAVGTAQSIFVVPGTHPTIQAAIAATVNGDTVLVLPGTYFERINFLGKAIIVQSTAGAAATTIDGNFGGPTVMFVNNEPPAAQLIGFTITHGLGVTVSGSPLFTRSTAGGIHCLAASPTIRACVITANQGGVGGPLVIFQAGRGGAGGIDAIDSAMRLIDCAITDNVGGQGGNTTSSNSGRGGAGGGYFGFTVPGSTPEILRCTFSNNVGGAGGTAYAVPFGSGNTGGVGGIELRADVAVRLTQCAIRANRGGDGGIGTGLGGPGGNGGFEILSQSVAPAQVLMGSCVVVGNVGGNGPGINAYGGNGGGVIVSHVRVTAVGCTFAGNATGTPLAVGPSTGGIMDGGATVSIFVLRNCVLWGNTRLGVPSDLYATGIGGQVDSSDLGAVSGSILGTGNISTDPLFVNLAGGDVHLTAASPCRHTGTPAANAALFDLDGDPRTVGPATDMGADEWDGLTGSREDLALDLAVNGAYAPAVVSSTAVGGDLLALRAQSPGGTFAGAFTVVLVEPWLPPIPPVGPVAFPELHVPLGALWLATLPGGVGASGVTLAAVWPLGLAGFALRFQAVAISPAAHNTLFAATAARDLIL